MLQEHLTGATQIHHKLSGLVLESISAFLICKEAHGNFEGKEDAKEVVHHLVIRKVKCFITQHSTVI